jgi:hypothetical protein
MFTGEAMRHLIAEVGIEHVVMGTDYPFPWNTGPVDHILSIPEISDADKIAMLGGACGEAARDRFVGGAPIALRRMRLRASSSKVTTQFVSFCETVDPRSRSGTGRLGVTRRERRRDRSNNRQGRPAIRPRQAGNARHQLLGFLILRLSMSAAVTRPLMFVPPLNRRSSSHDRRLTTDPALAGKCAFRNLRTRLIVRAFSSGGSFQGYTVTSAFGASEAMSTQVW